MWPKKKKSVVPAIAVPLESVVPKRRFARFLRVAKAVGSTTANLASDANTAVTQFRCARLARALRRNEALAQVARETLK